ncbi:molybdate ABC transporter substrate-binding protein [Streptomyces capparidis]
MRAVTPRRAPAVLTLVLALVASLAACGSSSGGDGPRLRVLAAASLSDAFEEAGAAWEEEHPGTDVEFSFAGSQELAAQVRQGVPADVLVTADAATMDSLRAETGPATVIARNRLVIAVRKGNPAGVRGLADLADRRVKVVLAAPEVPAGRYAARILSGQGIEVHPVSQEPNVRAVLNKVAIGEADAGLVYVTDAASARGRVDGVPIPDAQNAVAAYPAAALERSAHRADARAFVDWLAGDRAQAILRDQGFQRP